ncbi:type IV secretory system conjugative DNA transfer family protein [Actinomadura livida]|uniref:Type IV secretion system protein VirD4 n=1 Tax=Actinomadura livida TaxID=79909 RepID=A0A7W7MVF5_9ACTN|nr:MULTISPECIES: type IV secretory system conjugative DNA transfer family protein [Actinomadura]MBB4771724.1 type IV secretion system protein VirD4 [Actinomadura catellatispora]GGU02120.1 hypothetical protein GCM10010208_27460 [Actinomadura livida]
MDGISGTDPHPLLLGESGGAESGGLGEGRASGPAASGGTVTFDQPSHLLTIAPNSSGRAESCLVPNLLAYEGQIVVVDLNGAAYSATADARRNMGQTVVRLDPFEVIGPDSDALNPLELLEGLESPALETACQDIAGLVAPRNAFSEATDHEAFGLLCGVIGYLSATADTHSFDQLYSTMHNDDVIYNLAVVLDTIGKQIPKMAYSEIANFLQKSDSIRPQVLQNAIAHLKMLGVPQVQSTVSRSTVHLAELRAGAPVTIYLVIPPERLATHGALLRIWAGVLLHNVLRTSPPPLRPPLFLLDHCAALGGLPLLESVLGSGSYAGFRVWTFWHDLHQLRTTYPGAWPAIVSGSGAVQVFGTKDSAAASEAETFLGLPMNEVWALGPREQIVHLDGVPHRIGRLAS